MGDATDLQSASQGLAVGVSMIALFLGLRQWYERRARRDPESPECGSVIETNADRNFHDRQDVRRWLGVFVLISLATVVFAGSWVPPRVDGKGNLTFVGVWLVVMGLIVVALVVALWDWIATWQYARVKRQTMLRDHVDELRQHLQPAPSPGGRDAGGEEARSTEL